MAEMPLDKLLLPWPEYGSALTSNIHSRFSNLSYAFVTCSEQHDALLADDDGTLLFSICIIGGVQNCDAWNFRKK